MNAPEFLRLPPHSVEAEQSVIGALMLSPDAMDRVADVITEADFYNDDHRRIFRAIVGLIRAGHQVDILTVSEALAMSNEVDQTGGLAYLAEIAASVPSAANVATYARIVADKAVRRRLISTADEIAAGAFSSADKAAVQVAAAVERMTELATTDREAGGLVALGDVAWRAVASCEAGRTTAQGIGTGFADLDKIILGMYPSDYVVIAGRPSMGKTTLGMNVAENVAEAGGSVAVFSLEMGRDQLALRTLSRHSGVPLAELRAPNPLPPGRASFVRAAATEVAKWSLAVDESAGIAVEQIRARCLRHKRLHGRLDLVVIDYLSLIRPTASRTANSRADEVSAISAGLKSMAKSLHCPVIVLAQLSRKVEERADRRPVMSDLRESGAIEQDADIIILMYRDEYYHHDSRHKGIAEAIVCKHRNGKIGTALLAFRGDTCEFADLDHEAIADYSDKPAPRKRRGFAEVEV